MTQAHTHWKSWTRTSLSKRQGKKVPCSETQDGVSKTVGETFFYTMKENIFFPLVLFI